VNIGSRVLASAAANRAVNLIGHHSQRGPSNSRTTSNPASLDNCAADASTTTG
jgi:hypothetical protein